MYFYRIIVFLLFWGFHFLPWNSRIYAQCIQLFAVPEGKPTITAAHNTSATSIYLAWKPPSRDTIHGEFLGYRIGYRRREKADEEMKNIYIRDPAVDVSHVTFSVPFFVRKEKKKEKKNGCIFFFFHRITVFTIWIPSRSILSLCKYSTPRVTDPLRPWRWWPTRAVSKRSREGRKKELSSREIFCETRNWDDKTECEIKLGKFSEYNSRYRIPCIPKYGKAEREYRRNKVFSGKAGLAAAARWEFCVVIGRRMFACAQYCLY